MRSKKSENIGPFLYVVIEQYTNSKGSRIAKFIDRYEADMFCNLLNEKRDREVPYIVRELVQK
jgi:hypothetical protein